MYYAAEAGGGLIGARGAASSPHRAQPVGANPSRNRGYGANRQITWGYAV